jgi:diguanylate cyclase (GGDEF)-like protein/PAS domain S-box-containing protein
MAKQARISLERIHNSERFRILFDLANDCLLILDMDGYIIDINRTGHERLGYTKKDMLGRRISEFDSPEFAARVPERIATLNSRHSAVFESAHIHKDGTLMPIEVNARLIHLDGAKYIFSVIRDITERKEKDKQIEFITRICTALFQTNQALIEHQTEAELFNRICEIAVEPGGMAMTWIGLVDEATNRIIPHARFGVGEVFLDNCEISFRQDYPLIIQDLAAYPAKASWLGKAKQFGWLSVAAFEIRRNKRSYAVATFHHNEKNAFSKEVIELLTEMARDIGYALDRFDLDNEFRIAAKVFDSQEAIIVTDPEAKIIRVNEAFTKITGYTFDDVAGKNPSILQSDFHPISFYRDMWDKINHDGSWQGEIWDTRKTGEAYPKWLTISSVKNNEGKVTHYVGSFTDITEHKNAQEKILNLAFYDQLTGLPNRRLILERLEHSLAMSSQNSQYGAILYLDLDHFKTINDTQGHDCGDEVLQEIARRIQATVRHEDNIARIGGDEFVVLLENISDDPERATVHTRTVGKKLLEIMAKPYLVRGKQFPGSVSIGACIFYHTREGVHELLKRADMAMYDAKKAGRNTLRFYDPAMQETLEQRTQLEFHLRHALEKNEFLLYYQKKIGPDNNIRGAEVLLKWNHPSFGLIAPMDFIPLAEEIGLIVPIGKWVLEEACRQLKSWESGHRTKDLTLSVNISTREFKQDDFTTNFERILDKTTINPSRLILEITESMLLENREEFINKMRRLKEMGISFALDDFGTGYSSLSYLKRLPINELKIDMSFVKDLGVDRNGEAIVQTIIQMGKTLGMDVIAEGVETPAQREMLEQYGCHNFQGYLFGKPVLLDIFEQELV